MLKEQLKGKTMFIDAIESWQEAIRMGAEPLVNNGIVEKAYVEAIIQNVLEKRQLYYSFAAGCDAPCSSRIWKQGCRTDVSPSEGARYVSRRRTSQDIFYAFFGFARWSFGSNCESW